LENNLEGITTSPSSIMFASIVSSISILVSVADNIKLLSFAIIKIPSIILEVVLVGTALETIFKVFESKDWLQLNFILKLLYIYILIIVVIVVGGVETVENSCKSFNIRKNCYIFS